MGVRAEHVQGQSANNILAMANNGSAHAVIREGWPEWAAAQVERWADQMDVEGLWSELWSAAGGYKPAPSWMMGVFRRVFYRMLLRGNPALPFSLNMSRNKKYQADCREHLEADATWQSGLGTNPSSAPFQRYLTMVEDAAYRAASGRFLSIRDCFSFKSNVAAAVRGEATHVAAGGGGAGGGGGAQGNGVGVARGFVATALPASAHAIIFDTETTGFGGNGSDLIIQLGYSIQDQQGNELENYCSIWCLPAGSRVTMKPQARKQHKITLEKVAADGIDPIGDLRAFAQLVASAKVANVKIVAHNKSFDVRMLNDTAAAHGVAVTFDAADVFCTKASAKQHCGLKTKHTPPQDKAPSNTELFRKLFGREPPEGLHNALVDSRVTGACFAEGERQGWWS